MPITNESLYQSLKELETIPKKALNAAYKESEDNKVPLSHLLLEADLVTDENLGRLIANELGFDFADFDHITVSKDALNIIPHIVAKKQKAICFEQDKNGVKIATSNPEDREFIDLVAKKTGTDVKVYYATERSIKEALSLYKESLDKAFKGLLESGEEETLKGKALEQIPVAKIVDTLIKYAYDSKASDIHIEPNDEDVTLIRFRIDGALHDALRVPSNLHDQIVTRIKVVSRLRTDEHLSAQDGKMQLKLEDEDLDIRVSIVPVVEGEKVVMRLLSSKSRQFSLQDLGMSDEDLEKVVKAYKSPNGMVLSTGPTGSGKTTTIYSVLKKVNTKDVNISTIEDPVEYDIQRVNQIQVNKETNLTFADGLRSILRQDPDIIFVGEVRDRETAGIAINSAMTGHLVLSTLHTNDAATTLPRFIDMEIEPFLVASTINVIIAQRLVRKVCENCRVSKSLSMEEVTQDISRGVIEKYFGQEKKLTVYEGKGCEVCHHTGYDGRTGIFEVLKISPEIRKLITHRESSDIIKEKAIEEGMTTMFEDGIRKVANGITTLAEIRRVTSE